MSAETYEEKIVKQLRAEANINRINVSVACKDLIQFCQDQNDGDMLLSGFRKGSLNPFVKEKECTII